MKRLVAILATYLICGLAAADPSVTQVNTPGGDLLALGNSLTFTTTAEHSLRFVGNTLEIAPQARVLGNLSVVADSARVLGPVKGDVVFVGDDLFINASVGGDVDVTARRVELGPLANIAGKLRYVAAGELVRDDAARVAGPISRRTLPQLADVDYAIGTLFGIWFLGLLVMTALLVAVAPGNAVRVRNALQTRLPMSLLLGFATMVCLPVLAMLLLVTIIGAPFALLLVLCYPALLLLGYLCCGVGLGLVLLQHWRPTAQQRVLRMVVWACAGVLLLSLLALIPWVGELVALLALFAGLGSLLLAARAGPLTPESTGTPTFKRGLQ